MAAAVFLDPNGRLMRRLGVAGGPGPCRSPVVANASSRRGADYLELLPEYAVAMVRFFTALPLRARHARTRNNFRPPGRKRQH